MPCVTDRECFDPNTIKKLQHELNNRDAMLCAVVRAWEHFLETRDFGRIPDFQSLLNHIAWDEAGIPVKSFQSWWKKHDRKDIERRKQEERERRENFERYVALNKLTDRERQLLGIKA